VQKYGHFVPYWVLERTQLTFSLAPEVLVAPTSIQTIVMRPIHFNPNDCYEAYPPHTQPRAIPARRTGMCMTSCGRWSKRPDECCRRRGWTSQTTWPIYCMELARQCTPVPYSASKLRINQKKRFPAKCYYVCSAS
jgi:hypothetical protein